jgi:membrane protein
MMTAPLSCGDDRQLPVTKGRRVVAIVLAAGSRFVATGCPQHAAGIAYRVLFSLAPLAIVLVSIFGLVVQDDELRERAVDWIVGVLPVDESATTDVETAVESIASPASAAGLLSLLVFVWAASGMMASLRRGLETAMGVVGRRPFAQAKLYDLVLVPAAALLVLVSVGIGLAAEIVTGLVAERSLVPGSEGDFAGRFVETALLPAFWIGTVLALYRFVPAAGLRLSDALAGALTTALLFLLIALGSDLVYAQTTQWSLVYGSLTSVLVFLYSVDLYALALLFGAAVAAERLRGPPPPGPPVPLRARVRGGLGGLFRRPRVETDTPAGRVPPGPGP